MMAIIAEMKKRIPEHPVLKEKMEELMAEGMTQDEALNLMIYAWLEEKGCII